jgi:hypothetical protein
VEESGSTEVTASAVISFIEQLEDDSSKFYNKLAERFAENRETFQEFANQSEKNKKLAVRTYRETISDALEACFSFKGLNFDIYLFDLFFSEKNSFHDVLKTALEFEEEAIKFYVDVANCSGALLATIPRAFKRIGKIREKRKQKLLTLSTKS